MMRPVPWILRASLALLLLGLAVPIALRIDVEAGNDAWIDPSGAAWNDLQRIEKCFGRSDGFVIALFAADVLAPDALAWQRRVADMVRVLPGVEQVTALVDARDVAIIDGDIEAVPLLPRGVRAGGAWLPGQRERILQHPLYSGLLVSASGDASAIVVEPSRELDERGLSHLQDRLTELSRVAAPEGEVLIAGLPAQKRAISRAVNADQRITVPLIFAVLLVFLGFFLRDARLVLIAALAVSTALAWTYAVINAVGHPLDAVLGLLPPLVMGTTVITSLHLLNGHAETITAGGHRVASTLRRVAVPLSLTTLATLAGMIGLWWGAVPAVRSFAQFAAAGILAAVAAPILWLWALGPWLDQGAVRRMRSGPLGEHADRRFARLADWCAERRAWVISAFAVGILLALVGLTRVSTDCDFLTALPAADPVRVAQQRIGERLTGPLALAVAIGLPRQPEAGDLAGLARCAAALRADPTITHVISLADVVALAHQRGAATADGRIIDDLRVFAPTAWRQFVGPALGSSDGTTLRISARQRDGSVIAAAAAADAAATRARSEFPGCEVVVASGPRLLQETADNLLPSVWWGLAWDFPAIFLLILVFLRSLRLACIAVPMAALPLVAAYGALPLIGWPLDIGVAMIACIALGVIVDDVIYMLHAIRAHGSVATGAAEAGPVISAAATVLAASFLCCLVGGFAHTRHFGVMLAAAFAVGLAIVTMLIPALVGRRS